MEKLIELLNEFREAQGYKGGLLYGPFGARQGDLNFIFNHTKFPFIKWLVENDKIDTDAYKTVYSGDLDKRKTLTMNSGGDEFYQVTEHGVYESLLMLLSISDTPIEDLISYLR